MKLFFNPFNPFSTFPNLILFFKAYSTKFNGSWFPETVQYYRFILSLNTLPNQPLSTAYSLTALIGPQVLESGGNVKGEDKTFPIIEK